jgi:hypothetical protein
MIDVTVLIAKDGELSLGIIYSICPPPSNLSYCQFEGQGNELFLLKLFYNHTLYLDKYVFYCKYVI